MTMTDERSALTNLFSACWKDDGLKARFMSDPKAVLIEHGIAIPDGMGVTVVENTDSNLHITLPRAPGDIARLSDEELGVAAGGSNCVASHSPFPGECCSA